LQVSLSSSQLPTEIPLEPLQDPLALPSSKASQSTSRPSVWLIIRQTLHSTCRSTHWANSFVASVSPPDASVSAHAPGNAVLMSTGPDMAFAHFMKASLASLSAVFRILPWLSAAIELAVPASLTHASRSAADARPAENAKTSARSDETTQDLPAICSPPLFQRV
jgi:hypothetical protein